MKNLKKILLAVVALFAGVALFKAGQVSEKNSVHAREVQAAKVRSQKVEEGTIYTYKGVGIRVRKYTEKDSKGKKYTHKIIEVAPKKAQSLEVAKWDKDGKNQKIVMDYSKQPKE